jgi:hypothetical protein
LIFRFEQIISGKETLSPKKAVAHAQRALQLFELFALTQACATAQA